MEIHCVLKVNIHPPHCTEEKKMKKNTKILIADDFDNMRQIVKSALKQVGFTNIIEAKNGIEAINQFKKEVIGLILCDWNVSKLNGLNLLKSVRESEDHPDIPFIMITGNPNKTHIVEAVQAGVSDFIIKPFSPETLGEKIRKFVS